MPLYDLKCETCGRRWERASLIADRKAPCEECGGAVTQEFNHSVQSNPFATYFDWGLGREITSLGDRWAAMRGTIDPESGERRGQLDYRDKMSKGDLSARLDRLHERKQRQG